MDLDDLADLALDRVEGIERCHRLLENHRDVIAAHLAQRSLVGLREVAVDVYREPLPVDTVAQPLLRASILVRRQDEAQFMSRVERLRARWPEPTYRLLVTGPWAPYRFGGIDADDKADG